MPCISLASCKTAYALELLQSCSKPSMSSSQMKHRVCIVSILEKRSSQVPSLQWRHNGHDGISNHQPHDCLLNRLSRHRSKKTSKPCITGLCAGNSPVNSPHKWPVTRKMFPFDDVIMITKWSDILEYQIYCTAMPAAEHKSYFELTHKKHPISYPHRWAMGNLVWVCFRKFTSS